MKKLLIFLLLLIPAPAWGATYYVTKSGNDTTGDGSQATPWLTMYKAEVSATTGDTVHVGAGTYIEDDGAGGNDCLVATDGIAWVADGAVILQSVSTAKVLSFAGNTNTISFTGDFTIDAESDTTSCVLVNGNAANKTLSGATLLNPVTNFVLANSASAISTIAITGCEFSGVTTNGYGFNFGTGATGWTISNCTGTFSAQYVAQTTAANSGTYTFSGNTWTVTGLNTATIFNVYGTGAHSFTGNTLTIGGSVGYFLRDQNAVAQGDLTFTDNTVTCSAATGSQFLYSTGVRDWIFTGNTITVSNAAQATTIFQIVDPTTFAFTGNTIETNTTSQADILQVYSTGTTCTSTSVSNNIFRTRSQPGHIVQIGTETTGAGDNLLDDALVEGNQFYGPHYYGDNAEYTNHALLVGFNKEAIVRNNIFYGTPYGIVLKGASEDYSSAGGVFNNIFTGYLSKSAIYCKGAASVTISNNTFFASSGTVTPAVVHISDNGDGGGTPATGCIVKNNILIAPTGEKFIKVDAPSATGFVANNNDHYGETANAWEVGGDMYANGTIYANFAAWQAVQDAASISADPLFISTDSANPNFLKLSAGSPCRRAGVAVVGVTTDYRGRKLLSKPDIGAYQSIETIAGSQGRRHYAP